MEGTTIVIQENLFDRLFQHASKIRSDRGWKMEESVEKLVNEVMADWEDNATYPPPQTTAG